MKPRIRLAFADFWPSFDPRNNFFTRLLGEKYQIELTDQPDFLIYSSFGQEFLRFRCVRIFSSGENIGPDFTQCDYAFTYHFCDHPRHFRTPIYCTNGKYPLPAKEGLDPREILSQKTQFCNFVYSNKYCAQRNRFFRKLSKYKRVDSGGRVFNNVGGLVANKLAFIRPYKFTIAFENESYPGYTTEKIYDAMWVSSLPIYWGNPLVHLDFNPASFLNFYDYGSQEALIERVIQLDRDDELYCRYLSQPRFSPEQVHQQVRREHVLAQFDRIFSAPQKPVAQQRSVTRFLRIDEARRGLQNLKRKSIRKARNARYHLERLWP